MSKSLLTTLIVALALALCSSFSPVMSNSRLASTQLGFFGFGEKKKAADTSKDENAWLGGDDSKKWKGREQEDAAMWIEEDDKSAKKGKGKKK